MDKKSHFLKRIGKDERGVAYIEFALVLPILLLFMGGAIDLTRLALIHSKVDKAVFTLGDLVTQISQEAIRTNPRAHCDAILQLQDRVVTAILRPFAANIGTYGNYDLAVTSILRTYPGSSTGAAHRNLIEWRYDRGTQMTDSKVFKGTVSGRYIHTATLPSSLNPLRSGERVIATEMKYRFRPIVPQLSFLREYNIHKISYMRGRVNTGTEGRNSGMFSASC